jgi:hypothetical protein
MGYVARMGRDEKCVQGFSRIIWREETIRKTWHRWEDNIRTDLTEMSWKVVDLMHLTQDRDQWRALVNTVMKVWVVWKTIFLTSWMAVLSQEGLCSLKFFITLCAVLNTVSYWHDSGLWSVVSAVFQVAFLYSLLIFRGTGQSHSVPTWVLTTFLFSA